MAMRKVTDCHGSVLWLYGMLLSVRSCNVAMRQVNDRQGTVLWLLGM